VHNRNIERLEQRLLDKEKAPVTVVTRAKDVLVTTPGRDALAEIRKQYLAQASGFCAAFRTEFANFAGSDLLFDRFPTVLDRAFDQTVAAVAEDVARERIYHWDAASLRRELEARATAFWQDFDGLSERYRGIIAGGQKRDAIRAASADNRPSIIGGGFGVKGAAEGIAIATAANAAIGVVHGAASAVAKAAATRGPALLRQPRELLRGGHRYRSGHVGQNQVRGALAPAELSTSARHHYSELRYAHGLYCPRCHRLARVRPVERSLLHRNGSVPVRATRRTDRIRDQQGTQSELAERAFDLDI